MCSGRGGTVEVGQSEGHLTEDGDLVWQRKGFLLVLLQELRQTGFHFLSD